MTDEELEKKAEEFVFELNSRKATYAFPYSGDDLRAAYIAGAKENAPVWHDLRKNPDDLPPKETEHLSETVIATIGKGGFEAFYNYLENRWEANISGLVFEDMRGIIAWCEIPKFEEE